MQKDYEKLFSFLTPPEPPDYLFEKIMLRLKKERESLNLKRKIVFFSLGFLGSIIAFVPAFGTLKTDLTRSGLLEFMSLLFSDTSAVFIYWQSFIFAFLESIPILSILAFLGVIFVFLESLKFFALNAKSVFITFNIHKCESN